MFHDQPFMQVHWALVLLSILPSYIISRLALRLNELSVGSWLAKTLRHLPTALDIVSEINLAVFYFRGTYYDLASRIFRIRHVSQ